MTIDLYLAFVLASIVLIVFPGPNVSLLIAQALAYGPRQAYASWAGTSSAIALQLAVTALGTTSLLLLLSDAFAWLRWLGVAYLIYLGLRQWFARPRAGLSEAPPKVAKSKLFWQGFLVSATNPKTLLFYVAFFPQFLNSNAAPGPQLLLLSVTFLILAMVLDGTYVLCAGRLRGWMQDPRRERLGNRITGGLLIGAGLGLAFARRS